MNQAAQIHTGTNYDCTAGVFGSARADNSGNFSVLFNYFGAFILPERQIGFAFKHLLHSHMITVFVNLRAKRMNSSPFSKVQHTHLNKSFIRRKSHFAAECINFAHKVSLTRSADGGVAGTKCHGIKVQAETQCFFAHSCGCKRGLDACVACSRNNYIIITGVKIHNIPLFAVEIAVPIMFHVKQCFCETADLDISTVLKLIFYQLCVVRRFNFN